MCCGSVFIPFNSRNNGACFYCSQTHHCFLRSFLTDNSICLATTVKQLTPWLKVLLDKLTVPHPIKKSPKCYGIWRFITVLTTAHHLSISCARWIQSTSSQHMSLKFILILFSRLWSGFPNGLFLSGFSTKTMYVYTSSFSHMCHMPRQSHTPWFGQSDSLIFIEEYRSCWSSSLCNVLLHIGLCPSQPDIRCAE